MNNHKPVGAEILMKTYELCFRYALQLVGPQKAKQIMQNSYQTILPYFHVLKSFKIQTNGHLSVKNKELSENEVVGFAVWMQQFVKELKEFMVGLGKTDIEDITSEIRERLNEIHFYEYYHQAQELEY